VYDGLPLDGVEIRVEPSGEILLRGPMLLRAYRDETDPKDADRWFPTGDLGEIDPSSGRLRVFGRASDLIITGGENVWPEPVEAILANQPGVADVAVIGRADEEWGERVVAVVIPTDSTRPPSLDALRAAVKELIGPWAAPHDIELVDSIPRTALGKVRRRDL
jgi:O-succinylbenzoic acid--CoA ligase